MGTRNVTFAVIDRDIKVAQYCQWDGYPQGQGKDLAAFLTSLTDEQMSDLKAAIRACKFISDEEVQAKWEECGADDSGMVSLEIADKFKEVHPEFHRDTGAGIFALILDGVRELHDERNFVNDSLFCEFAYVADFDKEVLEIYEGFQTAPHNSGRFAKNSALRGMASDGTQYYPVALVTKIPFADLAAEYDSFVDAYNRSRDDESE